jgi:hypothetical protein
LACAAFIPERIPQAAERGAREGNVEEAAAVARSGQDAIDPSQNYEWANQLSEGARRRRRNEVNNAVKPLEEKALRKWAQANGRMLDDDAFEKNWKEGGKVGGEEHNVYYDPDSDRWFKRNNMSFHGNWLEYFHRIALNSWLFPATEMRFEGFVEHNGRLQPVASQPDVEAVRGAEPDEVERYMGDRGFIRQGKTNDYVDTGTGVRVEDLHDQNVVVTKEGNLAFIDAAPYMDPTSKMARMRAAAQEPPVRRHGV